MRRIIFTIISLVILWSCHRQIKKEIIYSKDYAITIETRGCLPGGIQFKAVIYNVQQNQLANYSFYKPHHLYLTRQEFKKDSLKHEIYDLELKPEVEDSIYSCVHNYLTAFNIDNKIVLTNGVYSEQIITDGACLTVQLEYHKKLMRCEQYNLKGIYLASTDIERLIKIINRRVPEKFQLF